MHITHKNEMRARSRFITLMLAIALCIGLLPAGAWAAPPAGSGGEATLTIVFGLDWDKTPHVVVNKTYSFEAGETAKDLLDKAVAAGDIDSYSLNDWGYPQHFTSQGTTLENSTAMDLYWATCLNNDYYDGSGGDLENLELADGNYYQFAWASFPTAVAPDWSTLPAPDSSDEVAGNLPAVGSATLTIVYGLGDGWLAADGEPIMIINTTYGFGAGATVADMLDCGVDDGDAVLFDGYALNSDGYLRTVEWILGSITSAADFSTYWSTYVDGDYYDNSRGALNELELVDGESYQFAWESYPTAVVPDWTTIGAPSGGGDPGDGGDGGEETPPATLPGNLQRIFNTLFANIAAKYKGIGEDWEAMDMAAIGKGAAVNKNAIIVNAVRNFSDSDNTNLQRSILALTALGIDATAVTFKGQTYNLVEKLATTSTSTDSTNGAMFALLAYTCGPYVPPATATIDVNGLIDRILTRQNADGGWSYLPGTSDADMTAMGIAALAPYRATDTRIEAAIQRALTTLRGMQLANGGFASREAAGVLNPNSTAMAVIALSAVGIDVQEWIVESVARSNAVAATPLTALLSQANATLTGFMLNGMNNDMATEQGFRALVAHQGFKNTGAAYNVYTQAAEGVAGQSPGGSNGNGNEGNTTTPVDPDPDGGDEGTGNAGGTPTSVPATGDSSQAFVVALAVFCLGMGVILMVTSRTKWGITSDKNVSLQEH